jgi:hypothetical protein
MNPTAAIQNSSLNMKQLMIHDRKVIQTVAIHLLLVVSC